MPIKSKDLIDQAKQRNAATLAAAMKSGDEAQMSAALATFYTDIHDAVLQQAAEDIEMRNHDSAVLAARGLRVLTSAEMNYYTKLGEAMQSGDPKMALTNFDVAMPDTIIDGVIGTIKREHPLLERINFQNTAYLTRIILADNAENLAKWGALTATVAQEITGSLKEINLTMLKLSAFMCISQDLIALGPQWLDQYVLETLSEAIAAALETGIVSGNGKDEPIGMIRNVSPSANVQSGKYPEQTPATLNDLSPTSLGALVAKIARDPNNGNKARVINPGDLIFLCNAFDYWQKIMPATTYRKADGTWIRDLLPIPADIMQTAALESGKALLGMPSRYFVGLGVYGKTGTIIQDDSVRFFEDERAYKAKLQGNARPLDEYAWLYLDISNLKTELPVLVKNESAE